MGQLQRWEVFISGCAAENRAQDKVPVPTFPTQPRLLLFLPIPVPPALPSPPDPLLPSLKNLS